MGFQHVPMLCEDSTSLRFQHSSFDGVENSVRCNKKMDMTALGRLRAVDHAAGLVAF